MGLADAVGAPGYPRESFAVLNRKADFRYGTLAAM